MRIIVKMPFHAPGIVIELGSYCCKAGFACDNHPVSIFRSVVGRPKNLHGCYGKFPYDVYIGEEAIAQADYDLYSPIVAGKIVHWDNMERIWHHIFYRELKVAPEERAVIVTTDPRTTILEKLKFCEIFFETLNVPALCVQAQSVMSLYGSGTTTGITVDLGYDITEVNPVYEGGLISYARMETNFSGCTINKYMIDSFKQRGENLEHNAESVVEDIIRHQLVVSPHGTDVCHSVKYKLPSGKVIDIGKEIHTATEMIFDPVFTAGGPTKYAALPETVLTSAGKCDANLHDELFSAVVVTGGLSAVPGLRQRLAYELAQGTKHTVNIPDTQEPYTVAWLGAAIFAGMEDSKKLWIHKHQFEEYGFKIVKNKFI